MIDAKDLRIGNWVNREYWNPHPTEPSIELDSCFIYSIQSDMVSVRISDKKVIARIPREKLHPIPLTPEILEKCGFEKKGKRYSINWFYLWDYENDIVFALSEMHGFFGNYLTLKSLHDLQNLYYALTKQELNYQP